MGLKTLSICTIYTICIPFSIVSQTTYNLIPSYLGKLIIWSTSTYIITKFGYYTYISSAFNEVSDLMKAKGGKTHSCSRVSLLSKIKSARI